MPGRRNDIKYPDTKWVGINLPLTFDKKIRRLQEQYEDEGFQKPSKADLIVELVGQALDKVKVESLNSFNTKKKLQTHRPASLFTAGLK